MKHLVMTALCASWVCASACGSNGGSGSTMTAPSVLNLAGTWTGTFGPFATTINGVPVPGRSNSWTIQWAATQNGANISGPMTLSINTELTGTFSATGTLSGQLAGTQFALTLSVPSGGLSSSVACAISANGSLGASSTAISGSLSNSFTSSCPAHWVPCDSVNACLATTAASTSQLALTKS